MARLDWKIPGERFYEAGVDRGVLYVGNQPGVPWVGLIAVNEAVVGGEAKAFYIDGVKYLNIPAREEFAGSIEAFTYPDAFGVCDGTARARPGLLVTGQRRQPFHLSYRTAIGNDTEGQEMGYKIHLIYNALAAPSSVNNATVADSTDPVNFSWNITTLPPRWATHRRSAHIVIDSRDVHPLTMAAVEAVIYGDDIQSPRMPTLPELIDIFDTLVDIDIINNEDGTFSINGPDSAVYLTEDPSIGVIDWPTVVPLDEDTYQISE